MAGVLISMRLRVLANSLTGTRAANMITGGVIGLLLALGTIWLPTAGVVPAIVRSDLLAVVLACWMFGWMLGPVYTGGGDTSLRPEQFRLLPIGPLKLAFGLLVAGFVGIAPVVTLIAFLTLVVYAAGLGATAVAVAVLVAVLQLVLVLILSRLVVGVLALAVRSRLGAVLSALVNAAMAVLLNQSWVLIWAAAESELLTYGFPPRFSAILDGLPSTWGLTAIEAAGRGDVLLVLLTVGGLILLIGAALGLWAALLVRRTTTRPTQSFARGWTPALRGATGVVATKELRTWSRDLMRTHLFYYSIFFGVLYTAVPLIVGWYGMLPWAGLLFVVMAAATSANLFGLDGTALWLTLVNPRSETAEVRGRQVAWLLQVGPLAVVLTVAGLLLGGTADNWPWTLSLLFATLGGGAGLISLISVYALSPTIEPNRRSGNPLEAGPDFGQVIAAMMLVILTAVPAGLVAWLGTRLDQPVLAWSSVLVGLATGTWLTLWGGRRAATRLRATGPELLATMRSGGTVRLTARAASVSAVPKLPPAKGALVAFLWTACWIPLFPQGVIPLVMILNDNPDRVWFAALYAPDPWRIPVAVAFILLAAVMLTFGTLIPLRHNRAHRSAAVAVEPAPASASRDLEDASR